MSHFGCNCKLSCCATAIIVSAIIGVLASFFQITGMITITTAFLWVALGIAVVYLALLLVSTALAGESAQGCCTTISTVLTAILGTILFALVLLAVGIVATSVISAILVGLLLFFLALTFTATACYIHCLTGCERLIQ